MKMDDRDLLFFLMNIFDKNDEIMTFCRKYFSPVYDRFKDEMDVLQRVEVLLDHCQGQTDELLTRLKETDSLKKGDKILRLLASIDSESMVEKVQKLYQSAYEQRLKTPEKALEECQRALEEVAQSSEISFDNSMLLSYTRGKICLLIASIHLNAITKIDWQAAAENYLASKEEFHSRGWSHCEGLASLGLAIAQRKLGNLEEAMNACRDAQQSSSQVSVPGFINTNALRKAIEEEYLKIQDIKSLFPKPSYNSLKKVLPVFNILAGEGRFAAGELTALNLLSRADYRRDEVEEVFIEPTEYPNAQKADYILEIDAQAKTEDDLKPGDWLFIQGQSVPDRLHGETVVVLADEGQGTTVGLKICLKADDHYFLKAQSKNAISIIVVNYKTSLARIRDLEALYYEKKVIKRTDDVQVSGPVIDNGRTLRQAKSETTGAFIWRIPHISHISAGLGYPITEQNIKAYVNLREQKSIEGANYFVLVADGDSMTSDGIFAGDKVLIRQQEGAKNKDIAAVVINTPTTKPVGVLKRYYVIFQKDQARRHWLLESSNPDSEHLVVMPDGADVKAIQAMYGKVSGRKFEFYEQSELKIAGVFVKVIEKA
jgi:SOS-response transcriptional repressor LexA